MYNRIFLLQIAIALYLQRMRRITKKILFFFIGLLIIGFYCEYLIYYVVIVQVFLISYPYLFNKLLLFGNMLLLLIDNKIAVLLAYN